MGAGHQDGKGVQLALIERDLTAFAVAGLLLNVGCPGDGAFHHRAAW